MIRDLQVLLFLHTVLYIVSPLDPQSIFMAANGGAECIYQQGFSFCLWPPMGIFLNILV